MIFSWSVRDEFNLLSARLDSITAECVLVLACLGICVAAPIIVYLVLIGGTE